MKNDPKFAPIDDKNEKREILLHPGDLVFEFQRWGDGKLFSHSWLYTGILEDKHCVIHSNPGKKVEGGVRHTLDQYFPNKDTVVSVIRWVHPDASRLMIAIAKQLAPLLSKEQVTAIEKFNKDEKNEYKKNTIMGSLGIPLTPYNNERPMTQYASTKLAETLGKTINTFRAVRVALRTGLTHPQGKNEPLSKYHGANCNQFVTYFVQATAVLLLLGKKIELLRPSMDTISQLKLKKVIQTFSGRKSLTNLIELFYNLAKSNPLLPKGISLADLQTIIQFPNKGNDIEVSFNFLKSLPLFETFTGTLVIRENQGIKQPMLKIESSLAPPLSLDGEINTISEPGEEKRAEEPKDDNQKSNDNRSAITKSKQKLTKRKLEHIPNLPEPQAKRSVPSASSRRPFFQYRDDFTVPTVQPKIINLSVDSRLELT